MAEVDIPYNFTPRDYQIPLYNAFSEGYRRAVAVWHRRAGKDKTVLNIVVREALKRRGSYYYFYPEYAQGKKAMWEGVDKSGFPFLDHIPQSIRKKTNNSEMKITLKNGSIFQIVGTDNINSIMSTNPFGCVFNEYPLQDPFAWDFVSPILRENEGWAIFDYTPRGHNHGYDLYNMAMENPKWFCELLTIEDTGVLTEEDMDEERAAGKKEWFLRQEYYCSFEVSQANQFIPFSLVAAAMKRKYDVKDYQYAPVVIGVDCAGGGDDSNVICIRQGLQVHEYLVFTGRELDDPVKYARIIAGKAIEYNAAMTFVDTIGVGYGVGGVLRDLGIRVTDVIANSRASAPQYYDMRAEMWDKMKRWMKEGGALPHNTKLQDELIAPQCDYDNPKCALHLESKKHMKSERNIDSTDIADATAHTFYLPISPDWEEDERYAGAKETVGAGVGRDSMTGY